MHSAFHDTQTHAEHDDEACRSKLSMLAKRFPIEKRDHDYNESIKYRAGDASARLQTSETKNWGTRAATCWDNKQQQSQDSGRNRSAQIERKRSVLFYVP